MEFKIKTKENNELEIYDLQRIVKITKRMNKIYTKGIFMEKTEDGKKMREFLDKKDILRT